MNEPSTTKQPTDTTDTAPRNWLRWLCVLVIGATFTLIAMGGVVTSNEYGLAVPDGFTTFGHFTLTAPLEKWWPNDGTRWEHSHRIMGMIVGMLTIAMAISLFRTQRQRTWLRWAGIVMLLLVISQGVMGALRVSEVSLTLAFVHGIVGQLILCSWVVVLAGLGSAWLSRVDTISKHKRKRAMPRLRWAVRSLLLLLLVQLTLGSAVRHFKADKSPPDLLIYGQVLPPMSQERVDELYVAYYADKMGQSPIESGIVNRNPAGEIVVSLGHIDLQMSHRIGAMLVLIGVLIVVISALRQADKRAIVVAPAMLLMTLLGVQIGLGVLTLLSETDPVIATLHQVTGATMIAVATWLAVRIHLAEYDASPAIADIASNAAAQAHPTATSPTPATA